LANYARYKETLAKIHADAPEWWKYNINTNELFGLDSENPLFMNLEASLWPLYGLTGVDFNDPRKRVDWWSSTLDDLGKFGPTTHTVANMAMAWSLQNNGEQEAARRWMGGLGPIPNIVKSGLLDMGVASRTGRGINNWLTPGGIDPYEERQALRQLAMMEEEGKISREEQALIGKYKANLDELETIRPELVDSWYEAVERAINEKRTGTYSSFFFGAGFKMRTKGQMELDKYDNDVFKLINTKGMMSPEEYRRGWVDINAKYPYGEALAMGRRSGNESDEAFVYNAMSRIPPGQVDEVVRNLKLAPEFHDWMSEFYDSKGDVLNEWDIGTKNQFMGAITEISVRLSLPDSADALQFRVAKDNYSAMMNELEYRYGDDIHYKIGFWNRINYSDEIGSGTKQTIKDSLIQEYPEIADAIQLKEYTIMSDPTLMPYYASVKMVEGYFEGLKWDEIHKTVPAGEAIHDQWDKYNNVIRDWDLQVEAYEKKNITPFETNPANKDVFELRTAIDARQTWYDAQLAAFETGNMAGIDYEDPALRFIDVYFDVNEINPQDMLAATMLDYDIQQMYEDRAWELKGEFGTTRVQYVWDEYFALQDRTARRNLFSENEELLQASLDIKEEELAGLRQTYGPKIWNLKENVYDKLQDMKKYDPYDYFEDIYAKDVFERNEHYKDLLEGKYDLLAQKNEARSKLFEDMPSLEQYDELKDKYEGLAAERINRIIENMKGVRQLAIPDVQQARDRQLFTPDYGVYDWDEVRWRDEIGDPTVNLIKDYAQLGEEMPEVLIESLGYDAENLGIDSEELMLEIILNSLVD
jgi:hypothetical protein